MRDRSCPAIRVLIILVAAGRTYRGTVYSEHLAEDTTSAGMSRICGRLDNNGSFWHTKPISLYLLRVVEFGGDQTFSDRIALRVLPL
jgi:hypothetical protein